MRHLTPGSFFIIVQTEKGFKNRKRKSGFVAPLARVTTHLLFMSPNSSFGVREGKIIFCL